MRFVPRRRLFGATSAIALLAVIVGLLGASLAAGLAQGASTPASAPTFLVSFTETGLPSHTNWSVHVASTGCECTGTFETVKTNSNQIQIPLKNGTYNYRILKVAGYVAGGLGRGTFNVSGAPLTIPNVVFTPVVTYSVQFNETGLPASTLWNIHVAGNGTGQAFALEHLTHNSTTATINFTLPNGTYTYRALPVPGSYFVSPSHGSFIVAGASPAETTIHFFTPAAFVLTITESGLPAGTNFSARVYGFSGALSVHQAEATTGTTLSFNLPNGTFHYRISEVLGFITNISTLGGFTISGAAKNVAIGFAAVGGGALYPVTFRENGLPNGSHWSIRIASVLSFSPSGRETQSSNNSTDSFSLQNGTYRYHVNNVRGYTPTVASGKVSVVGASPPVVVVNFTAIPTYAVNFTETGLPSGTLWSVLVRTSTPGSSAWPIYETVSSNTTTVSVNLPNGAYCYRINPVVGWHLSVGSAKGSLSVSNAPPAAVSVTFAADA